MPDVKVRFEPLDWLLNAIPGYTAITTSNLLPKLTQNDMGDKTGEVDISDVLGRGWVAWLWYQERVKESGLIQVSATVGNLGVGSWSGTLSYGTDGGEQGLGAVAVPKKRSKEFARVPKAWGSALWFLGIVIRIQSGK